MVILVDDEDRENEGDLVVVAEKVTAETINFMATHARGLICLSMTGQQVSRLGLPMMATNNQSIYNTAFTVSIEARKGVTTGISAADRAHTVQVAVKSDATYRDIVTPGHMFPLRARDGGVLVRVGQTEGSVDLARLAGLNPSAVICEIMKPDGDMARMPELMEFGKEHGIRIVAVADIIKVRMQTERVVEQVSEGELEIPGFGRWQTRLYKGVPSGGIHMAVWKGELSQAPTLARVQVGPPSWAFLNSDLSTLATSARGAFKAIDAAGGGAMVFMHLAGVSQESLVHMFEQEIGGKPQSTVRTASADALRDLGMGCQILIDLGLSELRLMTNSSRPIVGLDAYGLSVSERVPIPSES
jgi:3,4-dihydroxy 2-butanone 4-phosphate synthase/GTP cyclohydrolase II